MPSGPPSDASAITAARSSRSNPLESAFTRTQSCCGERSGRERSSSCTRALAAGSCVTSTESSRSRINASAGVESALLCLRSLSPGTKRNDLISEVASCLRPLQHERGATAGSDLLVTLIVGTLVEYDDARVRARLTLALGNDRRNGMDGVADENRAGALHLFAPEVA